MFCYQLYKSGECETMTAERFTQLVIDSDINNRIKLIRKLRAEGKMRGADVNKRQLPLLIFVTKDFDVTPAKSDSADGRRKKGQMGKWRVQEAVHLSGLYMCDLDHLEESPKAVFNKWIDDYVKANEAELPADPALQRAAFCNHYGIVLVHVTSSNEGLRLVAIADASRGNLADNQQWLASQLGFKNDNACKDASRGSFCPGFEDILYVNKEKLFTYENPEYDEKYGDLYRHGHSEPTRADNKARAISNNSPAVPVSETSSRQTHAVAGEATGEDQSPSGAGGDVVARLKEGYHGHPYEEIIEKWFSMVAGGVPKAGDRHSTLLRMAADFRYICDNDPHLLKEVLLVSAPAREVAAERGEQEIAAIADSACERKMWFSIPKRFQPVLQAAGIQLPAKDADGVASEVPECAPIDYGYWWQRLEPLLGELPVLREAVSELPEQYRLAGVLAGGAMLGTYLTRCWWEHFDGKPYRLSYLVYIVGPAACGKSFADEFNKLLMAPMRAADEVGRNLERQYAKEEHRRSISTKAAKEEAPEEQHPVIRIVPSSISNKILYERLQNAIDNEAIGPDGQPMHLHLFTFDAELAAVVRAQGLGAWAQKMDFELKSFHNEDAGVDFATSKDVNGHMQVNWNQVVTGTMEAFRKKFKITESLGGLPTRLVLFPMPENKYEMLEWGQRVRKHEREATMRSIGITLDQVKGELKADKLLKFCYDYEQKITKQAELEQDEIADYFRKRIPVIMMRYGLVRLVLRHPDKALKGEPLPVDQSDLDFVELIGDFCFMSQIWFFGSQVEQAMTMEKQSYVPRNISTKMRDAFASLPEIITPELLVEKGVAKNVRRAREVIKRWKEKELVEQVKENNFKKKYKEIPL